MPMPVFDQNNELKHIEISEIICIFKHHKTRKIIIIAECGEYYLPSTIDQIIQIMGNSGFYQIDSSRIINLKSVKWFVNGKVSLNGDTFVVSRRRRKGLQDALKK